jgi:hypothetical protein
VPANLHRHQPVVHHDVLGEEIGANRGLVLVAKLLVDILVHQRCLAHTAGRAPSVMADSRRRQMADAPAVSEDDDLEQHLLPGRHRHSLLRLSAQHQLCISRTARPAAQQRRPSTSRDPLHTSPTISSSPRPAQHSTRSTHHHRSHHAKCRHHSHSLHQHECLGVSIAVPRGRPVPASPASDQHTHNHAHTHTSTGTQGHYAPRARSSCSEARTEQQHSDGPLHRETHSETDGQKARARPTTRTTRLNRSRGCSLQLTADVSE